MRVVADLKIRDQGLILVSWCSRFRFPVRLLESMAEYSMHGAGTWVKKSGVQSVELSVFRRGIIDPDLERVHLGFEVWDSGINPAVQYNRRLSCD